jgi:hypothetical protein
MLSSPIVHTDIGGSYDNNHNICDNAFNPTSEYLNFLSQLSRLSVAAIESSEAKRIDQQLHSLLVQIQELCNRCHGSLVSAATNHADLSSGLPLYIIRAVEIKSTLPLVEHSIRLYHANHARDRTATNGNVIQRRKHAISYLRNVDMSMNLMELPSRLSSSVVTMSTDLAVTLEICSHIGRLRLRYPSSRLLIHIAQQIDSIVRHAAAEILLGLRAPSLKLATAIRLITWLRRVLGDLRSLVLVGYLSVENVSMPVFLSSRLYTFTTTIDALEPLRVLALREQPMYKTSTLASGLLDEPCYGERLLRRYIEIFRDHVFNTVSTFKGIFHEPFSTSSNRVSDTTISTVAPVDKNFVTDKLGDSMPVLNSFLLRMVSMLTYIVTDFRSNLHADSSWSNVFTQALYCASGLSRLGCDFGALLTNLSATRIYYTDLDDYAGILIRHRLIAGNNGSNCQSEKGGFIQQSRHI